LYVDAWQEVTACWQHYAAMLLPSSTQSRGRAKGDEEPANWLCASWTNSQPLQPKQKNDSLKLNERGRNVYENKGALWKARERSGNVYENKGA